MYIREQNERALNRRCPSTPSDAFLNPEGWQTTHFLAYFLAQEGMELNTSGTQIPLVPLIEPAEQLPLHRTSRRACIIPLYQWLSLGDGGISGVEKAFEQRSICSSSEAIRVGVDPFTAWTDQRARTLRRNLYNLLRAAGPREIMSRCGLVTDDRVVGRGGARKKNASGQGKSREDDIEEGVEEKRAEKNAGSLRRRKAANEAVRSARDAVLKQNQKVGNNG